MTTARTIRHSLASAMLSALYYVCFVPGALIVRALRQDKLQKAPDPIRASYWHKPDTHSVSDSMKYPF